MPLTMYDDVTIRWIPKDAKAVAGYVNGHYANFSEVVKGWPHAYHLSIAVTVHADAQCLDVEVGDARPDQAPAWVLRQIHRGVWKPVVYANRSTMPSVISWLRSAGIKRNQVRLWVADYTFKPHQVWLKWGLLPTRSDACQWTDKALGRSLDASLCTDGFFKAHPLPVPPPVPKPHPVPAPPKLFPKPPTPMPGWWWDWANYRREMDQWKRPIRPRPATAPQRIPLWAWGALVAYNKKHPVGGPT